jgi:hypothetical protein
VKTPLAGLIIGAFVASPAVVLATTAGYWNNSLGLAVAAMICVLMLPVSAIVAVFTSFGFRLGREIVAGRSASDNATAAFGLAAAAGFGALLVAACAVVFEGFLASYFAVPIVGAVVGSLAGAFCDLRLASRASNKTAPPVVPLEVD